ncbi:MAG: hypothetical protein KDC54_23210 [Lewinella sp.]|nr:hypothetical protein [Lewinella sp.]
MKFRRLQADELQELEAEFIRFLAANTVTGDDWEKLKRDTPDKADGLVDIFSDIVFEKIIKDTEYLEFRTARDIKTFHCLAEKIVLNGLRVQGETALDFTQEDLTPASMGQLLRQSGAHLQLYTAEKAYHPSREQEVFRMLENGALISKDGFLFKTLEGLKGG